MSDPTPTYFDISIVTGGEGEEALCDFLFSEGALGLATEDVHGHPQAIIIRASFAGSESIQPVLKKLRRFQGSLQALGIAGADGPIEVRELPVEDWGRNWKQHFKPLRVGRRLLIAPSWEAGPFPEGCLTIRIDPAMAFGTGHHATTRMCLEDLESLMDQRPKGGGPMVLDLGTGTGILAIAAARLGARQVVAMDTDPEACNAARKNLALHDCADRVRLLHGGIDVLEPDLRFDLILANLDTRTLRPLFPALATRLAPAGRLVVGGITLEDKPSVTEVIRASRLRPLQFRTEDGWLCLTLAAPEG